MCVCVYGTTPFQSGHVCNVTPMNDVRVMVYDNVSTQILIFVDAITCAAFITFWHFVSLMSLDLST